MAEDFDNLSAVMITDVDAFTTYQQLHFFFKSLEAFCQFTNELVQIFKPNSNYAIIWTKVN